VIIIIISVVIIVDTFYSNEIFSYVQSFIFINAVLTWILPFTFHSVFT